MLMYVLRRLGYMFVVLIIISMFLFTIFQFMPGDPVRAFMDGLASELGPEAYEAMRVQIRYELGLDRPIIIQYLIWIRNWFTGNWGHSQIVRRPVIEMIQTPMMFTVLLSIISTFLIWVITIPLGIFAAIRRGKFADNAILVGSVIGISLPSFIYALLGIVIFSIFLQWTPVSGMHTAIPPDDFWPMVFDRLRHMALPIGVMVFMGLGGMTRYVRSIMCDALTEDYVRTARAKGLTEKIVVYSHAFRNALIPMVTFMTGSFMSLFFGSVVIEQIFSWSGMGDVMLSSLMGQDFAVVKAVNVFYALVALVAMLLMDLTYGLADPRVKIE